MRGEAFDSREICRLDPAFLHAPLRVDQFQLGQPGQIAHMIYSLCCREAGDCGGQGPCVGRVRGRVRAFGIVVGSLGRDHHPRVGQVAEHGLVEKFIPQTSVEGEDGPAPEMGPYTGPTLQKEQSEPSHRGP